MYTFCKSAYFHDSIIIGTCLLVFSANNLIETVNICQQDKAN